MKVIQGHSQPEIAADIRLRNSSMILGGPDGSMHFEQHVRVLGLAGFAVCLLDNIQFKNGLLSRRIQSQ